jgi:hypothetical protein
VLAPGYTVQQTTEISAGDGHGLLGTTCTTPGAETWFPGPSTAKSRQDYIHLTNPDDTPAVVDLELYGAKGEINTPSGNDVSVPAHGSVPVRLSTLASGNEENLTLHVLARSGRVGAGLQAVDSSLGGDWVPASASGSDGVVLPGLPKDTTKARLVVFAPGSEDADLNVKVATPTGSISPAGHETLLVKNGMTTAVDLDRITQGEAGSLVLTPSDPKHAVPVVASVRVVRGKAAAQEMAFASATPRAVERATVSGNTEKGSTLFLTAPDKAAKVRVTSSAPAGGGKPVSRTVEVKQGATLAIEPPKPSGKGVFSVSVEPVSGGPVHACRMLTASTGGLPMFTLQTMPDDHATVAVPTSKEDLSILNQE